MEATNWVDLVHDERLRILEKLNHGADNEAAVGGGK